MELGGSYQNLGSVLGLDLDNWEEGRGLSGTGGRSCPGTNGGVSKSRRLLALVVVEPGQLGGSMMTNGEPVEAALEFHVEATSAGMKAYQSNPRQPRAIEAI